ncbi:phage tail tube protein [Pseudomonas aeruginosa]|nr:phage tail tube protein [Pseudomonas aeruginosa]
MSILTQGTQIYALVPPVSGTGAATVLEIEGVTSFNPGGNPADQIEDPCLSDTSRKYKKGLRTPGQATLGINADPRLASHVRLFQLSEKDGETSVKWAIGWSDGIDVKPTVSTEGDDFDAAAGAHLVHLRRLRQRLPFDFASNTLVATQATIQRSGAGKWTPKSA